MNIFSRVWDYVFPNRGARQSTYINSGGRQAGVYINEETALKQSACYACIRLLTDTFASIPMKIYNVDSLGRKTLDRASSTSRVLTKTPNSWQSTPDFYSYVVLSLLFRGRFYAQKIKDNSGNIRSLIPFLPDNVKSEFNGVSGYTFTVNDERFGSAKLSQDDMFYVHGFTLDGVNPVSPIQAMAESLGIASAASGYESEVYASGAQPKVALIHPGKMDAEAQERVKTGWNSTAGGTAVLEGGMTISKLSLSPADMTLIDQKRFSVEDIARFFRVPPRMVGVQAAAAGWSTLEMAAIEFVQYSLQPWAERIESAIDTQLLPDNKAAEFDFTRLLRGDIKTRFESYKTAIMSGMMSPNEARELEYMNAYEGGGGYFMQAQMTPVDKLGEV